MDKIKNKNKFLIGKRNLIELSGNITDELIKKTDIHSKNEGKFS